MSHILRQLIREMKLIDELDSSRERASFKPGSSLPRSGIFFDDPRDTLKRMVTLCQQVPGTVANVMLGDDYVESFVQLPNSAASNNEVLLLVKYSRPIKEYINSYRCRPVADWELGASGIVSAAIRSKYGSLASKYIGIASLNTNEKIESDILLNTDPKLVFLITKCDNPLLSWEFKDERWKKSNVKITWDAVTDTVNRGMWLNLIPKNLADSIKNLPCSQFEDPSQGSQCLIGMQADYISTLNKINSALGIGSFFIGPELAIPTIPVSITLAAYYGETGHPYLAALNYVGAALSLVAPAMSAYSNVAHLQKAEDLAEVVHASAQVRGMNALADMGIITQQEGVLAQSTSWLSGRSFNGISFRMLNEFAKRFPEIAGKQFTTASAAAQAAEAGENVVRGWVQVEGGFNWVLMGDETGQIFRVFKNAAGKDVIFTQEMTKFLDFAAKRPEIWVRYIYWFNGCFGKIGLGLGILGANLDTLTIAGVFDPETVPATKDIKTYEFEPVDYSTAFTPQGNISFKTGFAVLVRNWAKKKIDVTKFIENTPEGSVTIVNINDPTRKVIKKTWEIVELITAMDSIIPSTEGNVGVPIEQIKVLYADKQFFSNLNYYIDNPDYLTDPDKFVCKEVTDTSTETGKKTSKICYSGQVYRFAPNVFCLVMPETVAEIATSK
jgi:hypothetical protein